MHRNIALRREAQDDGQHMIPRGREPLTSLLEEWAAEGATTPETLRQKDREGDDLLESGVPIGAPTEGVTSALLGENSQVP